MAKCDPNDAIPRTCADAFSEIREAQAQTRAEHSAKLDAIYAQTAKTNGSVAELFKSRNDHELAIAALASDGQRKNKWVERLVEFCVGAALVYLGYLLR
jgi:hypothetical protein